MTPFKNFKVAVYSRAFETAKMADPEWLASTWAEISRQVHVDKLYLETHRDLVIVDSETLEAAKAFFAERGYRNCWRHYAYHQRAQLLPNVRLCESG